MACEPATAMTHFKDIVDKEPNFPLGHYWLGLAHLADRQNQLGFQSLVKALSLDNNFSDAELALADYYYKTEAYDLCLEHAGRIAEREPENYRSHLIMGNAYLAQGKYQDAQTKFRAAQLINPESRSPFFFMAMVAELSGKTDAALTLYKDLLDRYPVLADVGMRYANLLIKTGKINEARQYFENAVKRQPENPYLRHILGEVYLAVGNYGDGEKAFEQAVAIAPRMTSSYLKLAGIYENKGEADKQIDILKKSIEEVPAFSDAYMELAHIYRGNNQMDEAIEMIRTAVAMNTGDSVLENNLASLYLDAGREFNKAFELASAAYEKDLNDPAFADTLGWAYYHKGIYGQAVWYLEEAARLMATSALENNNIGEKEKALVHHHLAMALKAKEEREGAE
jgi:tetratricopeptide (TPR) repeat protein